MIYNKVTEITDSGYVVETLVRKNTPDILNDSSNKSLEHTTYRKTSARYIYNSKPVYAHLTATFAYDKSKNDVNCISKYETYDNNRFFYTVSLTSKKQPRKAFATLKYNINSISPGYNKTLEISCDSKGNAS